MEAFLVYSIGTCRRMDCIHWKFSNTTWKIGRILVISLQEECDWFLKYNSSYLLILKLIIFKYSCMFLSVLPECVYLHHISSWCWRSGIWHWSYRLLQADMFVLGVNSVSSDRPSSELNPWAVSAVSLRLIFFILYGLF